MIARLGLGMAVDPPGPQHHHVLLAPRLADVVAGEGAVADDAPRLPRPGPAPGPAPAPTFNDNVTTLPYDVGELTIVNYIIAKDQGVPIIGLPVVPNLFYPLSGITVNKAAGINSGSAARSGALRCAFIPSKIP